MARQEQLGLHEFPGGYQDRPVVVSLSMNFKIIPPALLSFDYDPPLHMAKMIITGAFLLRQRSGLV